VQNLRRRISFIAFALGCALGYAVPAAELEPSAPLSEPPTPPPGIPDAAPDTAPLPPGSESPAYDAIRQRCAVALDERSCIEAAKRDATTRRPAATPTH